MKTTILYTLLFFTSLVHAQSSFSVASSFVGGVEKPSEEIRAEVVLRNETNKPLVLRWVVIEEDVPTGWKTVICDHKCRSRVNGQVFILQGNEQLNRFGVAFRPNGNEGYGQVRLAVFEPSDSARTVQFVEFGGTAQNLVHTRSLPVTNTAKVYPNPATEYIQVEVGETPIERLEVYNIVGRKVASFQVQSEGEKYNISRLAKGMYLVRMLGAAGRVVRTQRINKYNP